MKRILSALVAVFAFSGCALCAAEASERPNIILIMTDDLGWADLGAYGNTYHESPNIDRLAAQGMRFTDAYANAANCAPSRACFLTGHYEPRHQLYTVGPPTRFDGHPSGFLHHDERKLIAPENPESLSEDAVVFGKPLQQADYKTALFGKVHVMHPPGTHPNMGRRTAQDIQFMQSRGFDLVGVPLGYTHLRGDLTTAQGRERSATPMAEELTDRAIQFIDQNKDGPFLLYISHIIPHIPLQAERALIDKYENKEPSKTNNNPTYAAMIEMLDASVGRLLDKLDALELTENTVVIFTSDNGGATGIYQDPWAVRGRLTSNYPLRGQKGQLREGGIRVPFIVRWPQKISAESVCKEPITLVDLFPTFLDLANTHEPQGLDGKSIVPLFSGQTVAFETRELFWHFPGYLPLRTRPSSVIRKGDFKLIETFEDNQIALYNLRDDVSEKTDIAGQFPEVAAALKKSLDEWQQATGARIPEPNPDFDPANEGRWRPINR